MSKVINPFLLTSLTLVGVLSLTGCKPSDSGDAGGDMEANVATAKPASNTGPADAQATSERDRQPMASSPDATDAADTPVPVASKGSTNLRSVGDTSMAQKPRSAAAVLKAEPSLVNVGEMATMETKSEVLTLTNTGEAPITIERAKTSCGCTTAGIEPGTVIQPGESVEVSVSLRGSSRAQTLSKTVSFLVAGMDPLVVPVRGQTVEYVQITPEILDRSTNPEGTITLRSIDEQPFKVTGVSPPLLAVGELPQQEATVQQIKLPWTKLDEYGLTRRITFHLDHPKAQSVFAAVRMDSATLNNQQRPSAAGPAARNAAPKTGMALVAEMFRQGKTDEVMARIDEGLALESKDNSGATLLSLACRYADENFVGELIERGADIEAPDNAGRTPLMTAAQHSNLGAVQVLIDSGAQVAARDRIGNTALSWAAGFGSAACVKELIQAGAEIEAVSSMTGWTPLIWAAGFGEPESVQVLVASGANLEVGDLMQGATPLINAARTGKVESIQILVQAGANLENKDRNGKTALLAACENAGGTAEKVRTLIEAGADVYATDNRGKNAYDLARARTDVRAAAVVEVLKPHFENQEETPEP